MDEVECLVVGGGVVGLAVARALAQAGREVLLVEAEATIGSGISSRNSEVIHAGLYYPVDSLKARLCVRGRHLLYDYCEQRGVAFRRCGKLLVATAPQQIAQLDALAAGAQANGVLDLVRLSAAQACSMEPALHCVAAYFSPSTGIVDSHQLMLALQGDAEAAGAMIVLRAPVQAIELTEGGRFVASVGDASKPETDFRISSRSLINCAGLEANRLAGQMRGAQDAVKHVPPLYFARGNYFSLSGRAPFKHLIYPMPDEAGLGVHLTLDLSGQAKFGPDVEWIERIDYRVDPRRADRFYQSIRAYWPALPDDALQPAYAGIRPKLVGPGQPAADFVIQGESTHGVRGLVQLFGIESPGLTASLALAEYVVALL